MSFRSPLQDLFGSTTGRIPLRGYVYVPPAEEGPMALATPGCVVRNPGRGRPWIVVERELSAIAVSGWPGRLWLVDALDPATAADQAAAGGPPVAEVTYSRCVAVRVVEEAPAALLFGPRGAAVCAVIDAVSALDRAGAQALCNARHPDAAAARNAVWRRWLGGARHAIDTAADFDSAVLAGRAGSPVGRGLALVQALLFRRAVALEGADATFEDDGDAGLVAPWDGAAEALCDAALGFGTPEALDAERAVLTRAWRAAIGAAPAWGS